MRRCDYCLVAKGDTIRSRCSLSGALMAPIDALGDSLTGMEGGRCTGELWGNTTGLVGLHGVQMGFCESASRHCHRAVEIIARR